VPCRQLTRIVVSSCSQQHRIIAPVDRIDAELHGRRSLLALLAAATRVPAALAEAAAATGGAHAAPALPLTFSSKEGFSFNYPDNWVVAFDRSGGRGDGAVTVVGEFRESFEVASVFRTIHPPPAVRARGLDAATGFEVCVEPQRVDPGTMRFNELNSQAAGGAYDFEYELETCRGEIQEGVGGVLRCLVRCRK
jgi:hypothetical protein